MEMERQRHRSPRPEKSRAGMGPAEVSRTGTTPAENSRTITAEITTPARAENDQNSRRRIISFSSETPYRRYFGMEILDHASGAVDLSRLNETGVLLFNHDVDQVMGKVIRAWVENSRGMAEVEFDTDADAEKIFSKVRTGTLKTTSVRYAVDAWEEVKAGATSADGRFTGPCMIARKWTPLEVSIVSVPADATVGVGRSDGEPEGAQDLSLYERQIQINKNKWR